MLHEEVLMEEVLDKVVLDKDFIEDEEEHGEEKLEVCTLPHGSVKWLTSLKSFRKTSISVIFTTYFIDFRRFYVISI